MNKTSNAQAIAARVAREKAAHENSQIDDSLKKWWAVFPHVFVNRSMQSLSAFYTQELGSIQNKLILEYGCGQGDFALWLLAQGAIVFGIDISEFNIKRCEEKARARKFNPSRYRFAVMNAHETTFPESFFDRVVGNGILHHLDLPAAMREIDRILKPGAKALFQEPLGENPLLKFYRSLAGIHTPDERPLKRQDLGYLSEQWGVRTQYSGLVTLPISLVTSIILRPWPANWLLSVATTLEDRLNNRRILEHWNRFAIVVYEPQKR